MSVAHRHNSWLAMLGLPVLALTAFALSGARADTPRPVIAAPAPLSRDTPVTLTVQTFKAVKLGELTGPKATVLVFTNTECPIANKYAPDTAALATKYSARGVRFVYVYSNAGTKQLEAQKHVSVAYKASNGIWDNQQALADAVGATMTPEVAVLDPTLTVRYRGRIDDRFAARGTAKGSGPSHNDLAAALDSVLAGKAVSVPVTETVGCVIERAPGSPTPAKTVPAAEKAAPTYAADIAPIIQQNCQSCHRAGEIGPMPFETYEQVKKYATNIVEVTQTKFMPPWKPVEGHGDFSGKRALTDEQRSALKRWAEAGAPAGDMGSAPKGPEFPSGWQLGKPDLVLSMPDKWRVAPNSPDTYRCFVLPTGLTEDKEVVAVEYRAGNKRVVHHVLGFVDINGEGRKRDDAEEGPGYTNFGGPGFTPYGEVGGWAPGNMPSFLPDGIGRKLPAGSDIVMQVHYHSNGQVEDDITQIGIYFAKKPIQKQLRLIPVAVRKLDIPAGEANHWVETTFTCPVDADVIFIAPHMHLLGRQFDMWMTLPDGTVKPLIKIDDWDFRWQDTYNYKQPIRIPKGAKVTLKARFDNSESNPRNPNSPPKSVGWGEATTDEMCIGFLGFTPVNENDPMIKMYDNIRQKRKAAGDSAPVPNPAPARSGN